MLQIMDSQNQLRAKINGLLQISKQNPGGMEIVGMDNIGSKRQERQAGRDRLGKK